MTWAVVEVPGSDVPGAIARAFDLPVIDEPEAARRLIHTGSDHSLALLADRVGPDVAILHAPSAPTDLTRMFGPTDVADRLAHGSAYPIELVEARSEHGRHIAAAHATASASGNLPGPWAGRRSLTIRRDGREDVLRAAGIVVANAQHVEGRTLAPKAALMDGRVDLQVFGGGRLERLRLGRAMRRGLHLASRSVHRRSVRTIGFELPEPWQMACDGSVVPGSVWEVQVIPGAATLWV